MWTEAGEAPSQSFGEEDCSMTIFDEFASLAKTSEIYSIPVITDLFLMSNLQPRHILLLFPQVLSLVTREKSGFVLI